MKTLAALTAIVLLTATAAAAGAPVQLRERLVDSDGRVTLGDLFENAGAVAEVESLQGGPADQAANWLADARARLAADKAVSELTAHVVAAIGAGQ